MNRIEEAIQKAKVAKAVRERDAERAAERARAEHAADGASAEPAHEARQRGARIEPFPRAAAQEAIPRVRAPEPSAPVHEPPRLEAPRVVIDAGVLESVGLWPDATHARRLGDEFRVAKRAVIAGFARQPGAAASRRVVAVTSALAGEGKSFSSLHLAISFALERGLQIVLIDGDGVRPTLSRALGCLDAPGLLDCLERGVSLEQTLRETSVERLWFLPAGRAEQGAAELFSSPQMTHVLDQALERFRELVVVMDTPPLLLTVEARALLDAASQTLLVVKANATPEGAILQALDQIGDGRPVQLLLNQRRESRLDAYQYYHSYASEASANAAAPH